MSHQDCPPDGQAPSEPATLSDQFTVLGSVKVIGKFVAEEKVTGRQRAEAMAREWRQSGLETVIKPANS